MNARSVLNAIIAFGLAYVVVRECVTSVAKNMIPKDRHTRECPKHGTVMPVSRGSDDDTLVCPMCYHIFGEIPRENE